MSADHQPLIVVVAYDRPDSLTRLLDSLSLIKTSHTPELLISIDNAGPSSDSVESIAGSFDWPWKKTVKRHEQKLGLKDHILSCADLSNEYGSVLILEDDLLVAPSFYDKAVQLLNAYGDENEIAGISLHTYSFNESSGLPFSPISGNGDVHLMQQVSSWGQAWTYRQWSEFRNWYALEFNRKLSSRLPANVMLWPDSSWKKHFMNYVVNGNKSIVYPNISLTSNCGDPGTHFTKKYSQFRAALELGNEPLRTPPYTEIDIRYDVYQELLPNVFRSKNQQLKTYDFGVDFSGAKPIDSLEDKLILTTRSCSESILTFGLELVPLELNVLMNIQGKGITLAPSSAILESDADRLERYRRIDTFPKWVHDGLGTPLKHRISVALRNATPIDPLNKLLSWLFQLISGPKGNQ